MIDFDVGLVRFTEVDADGFISVGVDVPGEKRSGVAPGEDNTPDGIHGRPHDPELDEEGEPLAAPAAGCLYGYYGGELHVIPLKDPRVLPNLPRPGKGGRVFFGGPIGAPSWVHFRDDGTTEIHSGASPASIELDTSGVTLGRAAGAVPIALATHLLAYLSALEAAITTAVGIAGGLSGGAPAASAFQGAMAAAAASRALIAATLTKGV